jgi:hypothetical protein
LQAEAVEAAGAVRAAAVVQVAFLMVQQQPQLVITQLLLAVAVVLEPFLQEAEVVQTQLMD